MRFEAFDRSQCLEIVGLLVVEDENTDFLFNIKHFQELLISDSNPRKSTLNESSLAIRLYFYLLKV